MVYTTILSSTAVLNNDNNNTINNSLLSTISAYLKWLLKEHMTWVLKDIKYTVKSGVKTFEQNEDVYIFLVLPKYHVFSFSTALQKLQKIHVFQKTN